MNTISLAGKLQDHAIIAWLLVILMIIAGLDGFKKIISWLLLKLYDLFIQQPGVN